MKLGSLVELDWESFSSNEVDSVWDPWKGLVGVVVEDLGYRCRVYWSGTTEDYLKITCPPWKYLRQVL